MLKSAVVSSNKKVKFFHRHCTLLKTKIDLGIVAEDTNCLPSSHEPEEKQKFHYLFCLDHNTFRFTRGKLLLFHIRQKYEKKTVCLFLRNVFSNKEKVFSLYSWQYFFQFLPPTHLILIDIYLILPKIQ